MAVENMLDHVDDLYNAIEELEEKVSSLKKRL
jgi:ubiquinone biosynthesis protein UbiJ